MPRLLLSLLVALAVLCVLPRALRADDDDPVVFNRKTSDWIKLMNDLRADTKDVDANIERRRKVLDFLRLAGPQVRSAQQEVLRTLKDDPSDRVRASAAAWLGLTAKQAKDNNVKPEATFDGLSAALREDKSAVVREAAAESLGEIARHRTDMRPAVSALSAAMKDESMEVRAWAAQALGRCNGRDAVPALDALIVAVLDKKADRFSRGHAAIAVVRIDASDDRIPPALAELSADAAAPEGAREDALRALSLMGPQAAAAVEALAKLLADKDADLRLGAATALAAVGPDARSALPALQEALKDREKAIRAQAIFALGGLGRDGGPAVSSLIDSLKDTNAEIRLATIRALAAIGSEAKLAVPALTALTTDPQADIREAAKDALQKIQEN